MQEIQIQEQEVKAEDSFSTGCQTMLQSRLLATAMNKILSGHPVTLTQAKNPIPMSKWNSQNGSYIIKSQRQNRRQSMLPMLQQTLKITLANSTAPDLASFKGDGICCVQPQPTRARKNRRWCHVCGNNWLEKIMRVRQCATERNMI